MKIPKPKIADILNIIMLLGLSVLIWFFVQQEIVDTREIEFTLNVQPAESSDLVVISYSVGEQENPGRIALTLRGSKARLSELATGALREIKVSIPPDVTVPPDQALKMRIEITDEMLHLPSGVTVVDKDHINVLVDAIARNVECKVKLNYAGPPQKDMPALPSVKVTGPRSIVNDSLVVKTEPVDSAALATISDRELALDSRAADYVTGVKARPDLNLILDPDTIRVTRQPVTITLEDVPIVLQGPPDLVSKWTVGISSGMTIKTLNVLVPAGREAEAKDLNKNGKIVLVLDMQTLGLSQYTKENPPPIPTAPVPLRIRPDWIEPKGGQAKEDQDNMQKMQATITGFKWNQ